MPFAIATTRLTCHTLHNHRCAHPDPTSALTGGATPNRTGADAASTTGAAPPSAPAVHHGAPTSNATPVSSPVPPPDEHGDATGDRTAYANGEPPSAASPVGHSGDTSSMRSVLSPVAGASGHGDAHHGAHADRKPFRPGCGTPSATASSAAEASPCGRHEALAVACGDPTAFAAPVERHVFPGGRHGAEPAVPVACASAELLRGTFAVPTGDAAGAMTSCVQPQSFANRSPGQSGAAHDEISPCGPHGCPGEMNGRVHGAAQCCTQGVPPPFVAPSRHEVAKGDATRSQLPVDSRRASRGRAGCHSHGTSRGAHAIAQGCWARIRPRSDARCCRRSGGQCVPRGEASCSARIQ